MGDHSIVYALWWWLGPIGAIALNILSARVDRWMDGQSHHKSCVDKLVNDPALLTMHQFQAVIYFLKLIVALILFVAVRLYISLAWLARGRADRSDTTFLTNDLPIVYIGLWFLCCWWGWQASSYATTSWEAYQVMRHRRNSPLV
jgi:hypothetical protein